MAKKKTTAAAKKSLSKQPASKKSPAAKSVKKSAAGKTSTAKLATKSKAASPNTVARKSAPVPQKSLKKAMPKTVATKPVSAPVAPSAPPAELKSEPSLGRPLVTQEEKLYWVFHEDFQARKVFEFLQVETLKELEQFSQQEIVHLLSKPTRMTVERIRERLAQNKRCLKGDEQFAADYMRRNDQK